MRRKEKIPDTETNGFRRILPDFFAFVLGLGQAYLFKWNTTDLVWSLWLCSLVTGYLTILSILSGGAATGIRMLRQKEIKRTQCLPAILIGLMVGLFFLGFFSLHFCGFHAIHSVFLRQFFPIDGMPSDGFGEAFMNPPLLWALVFRHLLQPYGLFLIPALIAERKQVFFPLIRAIEGERPFKPVRSFAAGWLTETPDTKPYDLGDAMGRPYINVVRMHLLIFFFAFCHILKIESFFIYAVVYSVYFFPWSEVKGWRRKRI
ncbi:MAG: hypothetical protein FJ222_01285 [Lentisphaerae bacterium]|nr:hypothetical protein [Lentisphaerota bacterium]